ncbi:ABC transporter permease [Myceligenerans pegani]|uniref:Autoinducer 2 import system permease protein LsrD n=1 Tax=Myceligenerans pegani TaxID=2776917 RepID=A0ABR9MW74_9MICO|nr:ABC transporter permease [Myceligenerans sp. TRM 65318]MBE1875641.1 ABC transporter permease [Myceligenerans sp. TRM 65318]MBE3017912.1 ABC transporter permease [Myceligenerans sp. TRM 65318]
MSEVSTGSADGVGTVPSGGADSAAGRAVAAGPNGGRVYAAHARPLWRRVLVTREASIIGLLLAVVAVATVAVPNFDSPLTTTFLLREITPILLVALPMTLIIVTEEIDLSVASVIGLSSVVVGLGVQAGWPFPVAVGLAVVVGAVAGAVNGALVTFVGLPSLAVTIGTLALFRGVAVGLLGTTAISDLPEFWTGLTRENIPGTPIPLVMIVFAALALVFAVVLHFTPVGRSLYAIGLNKEAAAFSGIDVGLTKFWLFVTSGAVAGFAGVYFTLLYSNARGDNAIGMELQVIAAVLLGGVSIFGGRGALHGVIAGVLLIGVLGSALRLSGVTSDIITVVTGLLLIGSVTSARVLALAHQRRARPGRRGGIAQVPPG